MTEINSLVILGLCATTEWKKALNLKNPTSQSLNILIRKALRENEIDLVWNLLEQIASVPRHYQYLGSKTFLNLIKTLASHPQSIPENMETIFSICERIEMVLDEDCATELTKVLQKCGYHAKITTIDFVCVLFFYHFPFEYTDSI